MYVFLTRAFLYFFHSMISDLFHESPRPQYGPHDPPIVTTANIAITISKATFVLNIASELKANFYSILIINILVITIIIMITTASKVSSAILLANLGLLLGGFALTNIDKVIMIKKMTMTMTKC